MNLQSYLLFHCPELWVQGFKVVSEIALSVHGGLKVFQRHLAQPFNRTHTHKNNILQAHHLYYVLLTSIWVSHLIFIENVCSNSKGTLPQTHREVFCFFFSFFTFWGWLSETA